MQTPPRSGSAAGSTFTVEAEATYDDGTTRLLRCADYNQITQAVTWVGERESIVLLLKSVN